MTQHSAAARFIALDTYDIRFPTSRQLDGSDAMNPDPDYSAAYVVLRTDADDALEGHGFTFTIGRGNDVQVAAIERAAPARGRALGRRGVRGSRLAQQDLIGDSQLRWLGPEKGVMHMAIGAVVNAVWDLAAKREGKPLWQLLADASPEWLASQVDFRYLTDALTPDEALDLLDAASAGAAERASAAARARLPGLHHLARLARLLRREADPAGQAGGGRRLHPDQAQGRRRPGGRHPPLPRGARSSRPGRRASRSTPTSAGT